MISNNWVNTSPPFRVMHSTILGIPSPKALRAATFPGFRIGEDPKIGKKCIIYGNVFIGNHFRCGDDVFIRDGTSIGDNVTIGNRCFIDTGVSIANGATLEQDVFLPSDSTIGERVFIGPGVSTRQQPGSGLKKNHGLILEDGCCISAGAILEEGICIGSGSRIAAGAVVSDNVPANVYVTGNPIKFRKLDD